MCEVEGACGGMPCGRLASWYQVVHVVALCRLHAAGRVHLVAGSKAAHGYRSSGVWRQSMEEMATVGAMWRGAR